MLLSTNVLPQYTASPEVRVLPSTEYNDLSPESMEAFLSSGFEISRTSDRMGFRMTGPTLALDRPIELVSASVTFGTIQLLPDGQLIVLMADHQTTGGYPRLATVLSVDMPLLAQLGPGDLVRFRRVSIAEAEKACRDRENELQWLKTGLSFGRYW
jgi:antagonist of KipI